MREDDGTWLGHVLEHVAIELQNIAGEEVTFGKTRSAGAAGVYTVVYEYAQRDEGIAAGELGLRLLCSLLPARCARPIRFPRTGTGRRRAMNSFDSPSVGRSAHRPLRWCARPNSAASPGSGSTISRWCSSDTASINSAYKRP
jgi:hypothetical protein